MSLLRKRRLEGPYAITSDIVFHNVVDAENSRLFERSSILNEPDEDIVDRIGEFTIDIMAQFAAEEFSLGEKKAFDWLSQIIQTKVGGSFFCAHEKAGTGRTLPYSTDNQESRAIL